MSNIIVKLSSVSQLNPHPNADKLELAIVGGWQVVVGKGSVAVGDVVFYVPPDAVLPVELSDKIGVTKYLSNGRVKVAKLRGEPSVGLVFKPEGEFEEGRNYAEHFGITKYDPPVRFTGDGNTPPATFLNYTNIENLRHFPDVFNGIHVVVTEKIHGTQCCVGLIDGKWVARSKGLQRPEGSLYWWPLDNIPGVKKLLDAMSIGKARDIQLFGEIYGKGVQDLAYGNTGIKFRAFDLMSNGKFLDYWEFKELCDNAEVPTAPLVMKGEYNFAYLVDEVENRKSLAAKFDTASDEILEGYVVKSSREMFNPKHGRMIFKLVSNKYLTRGVDDFKDE